MNNQDLDRLVAVTAQRAKNAIKVEHDLAVFANEYGDIAKDRTLAGLTGAHVDQLLAHDAQRGVWRQPIEVFREAGNAVRTWRDQLAGPRETESTARRPQ